VRYGNTSMYLFFLLLCLLTTSRTHHPIKVDGHTLSVAAIVAAARHAAPIRLDDCKRTKDRIEKSRRVVVDKVESGASVYGLSTGFGGSGMSFFVNLLCPICIIYATGCE
jgi:hypothetical protein